MARTLALSAAVMTVLRGVAAETYDFSVVPRETTVRRALQATGMDICGDQASLSTSPGTLYDDQPNIDNDPSVDCTTGACNGLDASCFGGVCAHANGYGDYLDCSKTISAPSGQTIRLIFSYLVLEQHPSCSGPDNACDWISIYDGPDENSPLIGEYGGLTLPPVIVTTGNNAVIHFHTDAGNYGLNLMGVHDDPGFFLDWTFEENVVSTGQTQSDGSYGICPAPVTLTSPFGTIHDDENADIDCTTPDAHCGSVSNGGYQDNLNCYTTIHAPTGSQVQFTFTQMNLEGPGQLPGCQPCTDPRGCDWVALYDGATDQAPLIGTYTGNYIDVTDGSSLPSVISSGQDLHIRFLTDYHNCGIDNSEDPGFYADWVFIENGQNICEPDAAVLTDPRGVLHDDDPAGDIHCEHDLDCGLAGGDNGYSDNLDCGVRLHAGQGETVNLHFTQMNLEGGDNGLCGHDVGDTSQVDCSTGCSTNGGCGDYVEIYDGRDASAPLLAHVTGAVTDARGAQDSFTSTGRNMFVRFVTDTGNWGLTGTTDDPGFWLEWQFIADGQECMDYTVQEGVGIVGHNNENFDCVADDLGTSCEDQCEQACCARDWCKSFDMANGANSCALADVDATLQQGATVAWSSGNLHERLHEAPTSEALGPSGCEARMAELTDDINDVCCPNGGCSGNSFITYCTTECDSIWSPFALECSEWLRQDEVLGEDGYAQVTNVVPLPRSETRLSTYEYI